MLRAVSFVCGLVVGVMVLAVLVAGVSTPSPSAASAATTNSVISDTPQDSGQVFARPGNSDGDLPSSIEVDPDDGTKIDLQGDEVTPALARYRFDAQGNIYETHAPHTEVPRLGPPQT